MRINSLARGGVDEARRTNELVVRSRAAQGGGPVAIKI